MNFGEFAGVSWETFNRDIRDRHFYKFHRGGDSLGFRELFLRSGRIDPPTVTILDPKFKGNCIDSNESMYVINGDVCRNSKTADIANMLSAEFYPQETLVGANFYVANKVGMPSFSPHCDVDDNFVVHVEGSVRWTLYKNKFYTSSRSTDLQASPIILDEFTMTPGDVLYIPCFRYHHAQSLTPRISVSFPVRQLADPREHYLAMSTEASVYSK